MSYDVGVIDAQRFEQDHQVQRLRGRIREPGRAAEPRRIVSKHPVTLTEDGDLIIPNTLIVGPAVNEHHSSSPAGHVVVDDGIADIQSTCLGDSASVQQHQRHHQHNHSSHCDLLPLGEVNTGYAPIGCQVVLNSMKSRISYTLCAFSPVQSISSSRLPARTRLMLSAAPSWSCFFSS